MTRSQENRDKLPNLTDTIHELDRRIRELESDTYNMRRDNDELRRRVSDLESKKRIPPF